MDSVVQTCRRFQDLSFHTEVGRFFVLSLADWGHFLYSPRGAHSSTTSCFIYETTPTVICCLVGRNANDFWTTCPMVDGLQFSLHAAASPFRPPKRLLKRAELQGCSIRWELSKQNSQSETWRDIWDAVCVNNMKIKIEWRFCDPQLIYMWSLNRMNSQ